MYRPPAEPPDREFVEDVVKAHLAGITALDRPLIELLIDMLLSDAGFSGGNTTREDLLEDLTLKLVDLADTPASARLAGTEALALPIATTLLDETWISATPGKKPSVQVRELSEAKAAVERWQPRFSAGEWSAEYDGLTVSVFTLFRVYVGGKFTKQSVARDDTRMW